jgi:hypothetical protein
MKIENKKETALLLLAVSTRQRPLWALTGRVRNENELGQEKKGGKEEKWTD